MNNVKKKSDTRHAISSGVAETASRKGDILIPMGFLLAVGGAAILTAATVPDALLLAHAAKDRAGNGNCVSLANGKDGCDQASSYQADWIGGDCSEEQEGDKLRNCDGKRSQTTAPSSVKWEEVAPVDNLSCTAKVMICTREEAGGALKWVNLQGLQLVGKCGFYSTVELSGPNYSQDNGCVPTPTPDGGEK